jgi:hypothetical protein
MLPIINISPIGKIELSNNEEISSAENQIQEIQLIERKESISSIREILFTPTKVGNTTLRKNPSLLQKCLSERVRTTSPLLVSPSAGSSSGLNLLDLESNDIGINYPRSPSPVAEAALPAP